MTSKIHVEFTQKQAEITGRKACSNCGHQARTDLGLMMRTANGRHRFVCEKCAKYYRKNGNAPVNA